jgi:hypothetical protein
MRFLFFLFFILIQTPNVFASRSRMAALNQDPIRGSFFIEDTRNLFRDPALINVFKNYATMELEFRPEGSPVSAVPQGGYFTEIDNTPVGVFLGQGMAEGVLIEEEVFSASPSDLFIKSADSNPVSFFVGGRSIVKDWGLELRLANSEKTTGGSKASYQGIAAALGFDISNFQFYGKWGIKETSKVEGSNTAANGKATFSGFIAGIIYNWDKTSFLVDYISTSMDLTGRSVPNENGESSANSLDLGVGHIYDVTKTGRLFFNLVFDIINKDYQTKKVNETNLPLVLGMEMDATSWLIFRGSVKQNIFVGNKKIEANGNTIEVPPEGNTARVNLGATFDFGKLKVDGNLGMNNVSLIDFNAFFANASITYWF